MKALIKIFVFVLLYLAKIKAACVVEYNGTAGMVPSFEKQVGKLKIRIPRNLNENSFHLEEGETVEGFCETYFSPIIYEIQKKIPPRYPYDIDGYTKTVEKEIINQTKITLQCCQGSLCYGDVKLSYPKFSCVKRRYSIYSARQPFPWCERLQNSNTFLFAAENLEDKHILASFCYNIEHFSLKAVVYKTLKSIDIRKLVDENWREYLDENLWNFQTSIAPYLSEEILGKQLSEMSERDEWLNLANYEVSSIVQDKILMEYLEDYGSILNIIWWRNLRVGNWQRFQNTLRNYDVENDYELYVGTSGVVKYLTGDKCQEEGHLEFEFGFKNYTIPGYIWTYLKSTNNNNMEFVLVAYNSPYTEFFKSNTTQKIIFCPDICGSIPWLEPIVSSFRYAVAGLMFCCSTDFIRQTNYLEGFPIDILPPIQSTTTAETTTV